MPRVCNPITYNEPTKRRVGFFQAIPFFDVLLTALMISLLSSKFLLAPGIGLELPKRLDEGAVSGVITQNVLTVQSPDLIFFGGSIYNLGTLKTALKNEQLNAEEAGGRTLLIKAAQNLDIDTLLSVSELAAGGGFERIYLASEER